MPRIVGLGQEFLLWSRNVERVLDVGLHVKSFQEDLSRVSLRLNMMDKECKYTSICHFPLMTKFAYSPRRALTLLRKGRTLFRTPRFEMSELMCRTIREALGIGTNQNFREKLILDAELVLWDQEEEKIAEFHNLSTYLKEDEQ